jgi:hypothetical protein
MVNTDPRASVVFAAAVASVCTPVFAVMTGFASAAPKATHAKANAQVVFFNCSSRNRAAPPQ